MTQTDEHIREHVHRLLFDELNLCCGFPEDSYDLWADRSRDLFLLLREREDQTTERMSP